LRLSSPYQASLTFPHGGHPKGTGFLGNGVIYNLAVGILLSEARGILPTGLFSEGSKPPPHEQRTPAGKVEYCPVSYSRRFRLDNVLSPLTPGVRALICVTTAAYLLALLPGLQGLAGWLVLSPSHVLHGEVWRLATYMLLHGPPLHLVFNMLSLWMFGTPVESQWGTKRFVQYYLGCGVAAGATTLLTASPTIGASGAVFGVLVAFAMLFPNLEVLFLGIFPLKAAAMVALLVVIELLTFAGAQDGATAYICHLGGAAAGYAYLKYSWRVGIWLRSVRSSRKPAASSSWSAAASSPLASRPQVDSASLARDFSARQATRTSPAVGQVVTPPPPSQSARPRLAAEEIAMQQRADQILDKISREGMSSLSREERELLNRHSQLLKSRESGSGTRPSDFGRS
jgi:membrane associated rhomboid family serine protease